MIYKPTSKTHVKADGKENREICPALLGEFTDRYNSLTFDTGTSNSIYHSYGALGPSLPMLLMGGWRLL